MIQLFSSPIVSTPTPNFRGGGIKILKSPLRGGGRYWKFHLLRGLFVMVGEIFPFYFHFSPTSSQFPGFNEILHGIFQNVASGGLYVCKI